MNLRGRTLPVTLVRSVCSVCKGRVSKQDVIQLQARKYVSNPASGEAGVQRGGGGGGGHRGGRFEPSVYVSLVKYCLCRD